MRPEQPASEDTASSRPDSTMHQVPGLRTKQIRWHSTPRPRSQPTFGHKLNLKIAHSARRVWKESLFVMDSFTGRVHGSGQAGTQLIRCWNSGIQLRARDREFGLGCTLRTRRRPPSPRLNALQVSTTLLTTTRRSCPSGYPHLPPVWERRNHSTSASSRPSSKQGPTLSKGGDRRREITTSYLCHGRGRGFESRRPRHSFQGPARRHVLHNVLDIVVHFFDAEGLASKDLTEINFLAARSPTKLFAENGTTAL